MNNLPKNLKLKLPYTEEGYTLTPVTDGTAYYKIVYEEDGIKTTEYYNEKGQLHRDNDKPAGIRSDGNKHWNQNGKLHRDNGKPAIIYADGTKAYYRNGKEYDLPALEHQVKLSKNSVKNHLHDLATAKKVLKADQDRLASYKKEQEAGNDQA